ncbi:MAG: hypothetical protein B7Z80_13910 [Rhodospirillales bacterium 20-64-7]|nr:MAG: hypothetical protein B7Z80_13910 [Rhodospirillales bacterium 20-64-7]HQT76948.1 hypothetical protein [Rhodopila sp.]
MIIKDAEQPMATTTPYQPNPFVKHLLLSLLPYFTVLKPDEAEIIPADIVETLSAYGARTRAEMLHAALIVAFGFSALDTLAQAKADPELSPTLRLRYRTCANALNRAAQQNGHALTRRLSCDPPATHPVEPADDMPAAQAQDALRQARAKIDSYRNRLTPARPSAVQPNRRDSTLAHLFPTMPGPEPLAAAP